MPVPLLVWGAVALCGLFLGGCSRQKKSKTQNEEESKEAIDEEEMDTSPVEEAIVMCTCATDVNSTSKLYAEDDSEITNGKKVLNHKNIDFKPPFKYCSITNGVCSKEIENGEWQEYDETHTTDDDKYTLLKDKSFMFCLKGGIVYITEDGQKIKDIEEFFGGGILKLDSLDNVVFYMGESERDIKGFYMGESAMERAINIATLNYVLEKYDINTDVKVAYFLGQVAKESRFGTRTLEGYNGNNPEEYFNNKYNLEHAKRTGTGNLGGNDGELFRGAGYIQLTGRANYEKFASYIGDDIIIKEGYKVVGGIYNKDLNTIEYNEAGVIDVGPYAWEAAGWFWKYGNPSGKDLSSYAEAGNWKAVSEEINKYDSDTFLERNMRINEVYYSITGESLGLPEPEKD